MSQEGQTEIKKDGEASRQQEPESKSDDQKKSPGKDAEGEKSSGNKNSHEEEKPKKPPLYKRRGFLIGFPIVLLLVIATCVVLWLILRQYVSTDDAYIDGHVSQISPQVSARVIALHIDDNQFVHTGEVLAELDPTDYLVALEQAKAQVAAAQGRLEQAKAQVGSAKASVVQADAEVEAAQITYDNAIRDAKRYQEVDARARSQQQLDNATTSEKNAHAQLDRAKASRVSANASVTTAEAMVKAAEGELQTSAASVHRAEVNLGYCKIVSPVSGRVTERTVEVGNFVTIGQALFMLVDPNVWVTANFKETQLTHLRQGQDVTIKVDAFPKLKLHGRVDSIQAGSGSRFSVLPAENATGNYVKVVQRIPVKIIFEHDANTNNAPMLSPGQSVIPRVKVR